MKAHISKHKRKYMAGLTAGCVLEFLNVAGALGPIICNLPFVPVESRAVCLEAFSATKEASKAAMELDKDELDEGSADESTVAPIPTITTTVE